MKASDAEAQAVFLAGLPRGANGQLIPGHTTWDMLGPKAKERNLRMAQAALDSYTERQSVLGQR